MDSTEIWKFITAALACTISLSKIGIPSVIAIYKSNMKQVLGAIFVKLKHQQRKKLLLMLELLQNGTQMDTQIAR